ncbi:MAG: glycerate kinase [Pseudomonadota bacterium]|nr:glycerate kinase [Pseudomonadota bacterium]MEE3360268.1 glycerate kinase [Pseudomonadota bacterium]
MSQPITDPRRFLTELFHIAVQKADPMEVIAQHLPERPNGRLFVIGAGKASARMAEAVEATYGPCEGFVITRYGYARPCQGIEIVEAAHPVPDQAGVDATKRMLELVKDLGPDDTVLALISGGGSALLCAPIEGLTLADKQAVNATLLASGAPIGDMNVVRPMLSQVKGGRLAAACHPAKVISLLISDVPGDDPAEIASGPTCPSKSSPQIALEVLDRHGIVLDPKVTDLLKSQDPDPITEMPEGDKLTIVAAPSQSLAAAAELAEQHGCEVRLLGDAIEGEARDLGAAQAQMALDIQAKMEPDAKPVLLLSGGECTVTRTGNGVGGPNAEYTLSVALTLNGQSGIHALACDTDGVDGAAEVAGAYTGPSTLTANGYSRETAETALIENDAHRYFDKVGGQIVTGPTLTNVNDFRALLILPQG